MSNSMRKDWILYLTASVIQRGAPILILPFLTRILSGEAVGIMSICLVISNLLSIVLAGGIQFSIVRLAHDKSQEMRRGWPQLFWIQSGFAIVGAVLVGVTVPLWSPALFPNIGVSTTVFLAVGYSAFLSIQNVLYSVSRTLLKASLFVRMTLVQAAGGQVVGFLLAMHFGISGYFLGLLLGATGAIVMGLLGNHLPFAFGYRLPWVEILGFSAWFLVANVSTWVLNMSDRLLVERYSGLEDAGQYYLAYIAGTALLMILDAAQSAWVPRYFAMAEGLAKERILQNNIAKLTTISAVAAIAVSLVMPTLLAILTPNPSSWMLTAACALTCTAAVRTPYLLAVAVLNNAKNSRTQAWVAAFAGVVTIAACVFFIPLIGPVAAAYATVVGYALQTILIVRAALRLVPCTPRKVLLTSATWCGSALSTFFVVLLPGSGIWIFLRWGLAVIILLVAAGVIYSRRVHQGAR